MKTREKRDWSRGCPQNAHELGGCDLIFVYLGRKRAIISL
ncbi:hypothetical protein IMCC12053_2191 [Celeribacter marinus]|uniref:Uncharacterized protein n=1 Tax=Celeribacter marinus TaxID=1397108 RepID=A0A0N9ZKD6_9RHOB|nr:hypothetical protein IMCC12053_2191 [Celeribacter marinus]